MKRTVIEKIERWDVSGEARKPLILMGARQVGKTWLMRTFAEAYYPDNTVFVDLRDDVNLCEAIEASRADAMGILEIITTATGKKIVPGKTLLVLDEIQESPRLLSSLKYFQAKSLKSYRDRFSPVKCLRTSLSERTIGTTVDDIPL